MREYNPHELNWGYYDDDGNYNPPSRPYKNGCRPPKSGCSCKSKDQTSAEIDRLKKLVSELEDKVKELAKETNGGFEEEPKIGFIIEPMEEDCISADDLGYEDSDVERAKELGIWFETEEETEKAVEKLKVYKRLRDKGFRFDGVSLVNQCVHYKLYAEDDYLIPAKFKEVSNELYKDLELLFGKEGE